MFPTPMQISAMVAAMRSVVPIAVASLDATHEWLKVSTGGMSDHELFQKLRFRWPQLVGHHKDEFALVHCRTAPQAGVWLHHLSSEGLKRKYLAGCYEVATWNQQVGLSSASLMPVYSKK